MRMARLWLMLVLELVLAAAANAAVYTVDNNEDFTVAQNCTAAPNDCSLRAAITFANNSPENDTINFDPAYIGAGQELALFTFVQLTIANNGTLTINGPGAKLYSINGVNLVRVFNVSAGATATISGITIRNGFTNGGEGGGIRNAGNLTVNSCEIKFNTGSGSDPFRFGGGGGIWNVGNLNLINSTVYGNTAIKSTQNNGSPVGGGILNYSGGTANIINSTISGNKASDESGGSGGGIWNEGINNGVSGVMTLINSTVVGNMLEGNRCDGGGVFNNGGTVNARNTIFAGNTGNCSPGRFNGPDFNGRLVSQGYNLIGIQECFISGGTTFCRPEISGNTTGNILNVNAQVGPLADNGGQTLTHALLTGSPAINAGSNALAVDQNNNPLTTDQRGAGFPRINNGTVDMGAYETLLLPANTTTTITADTPDPSNVGQSVTVSYTVTSGAGTPTGNVTVSDGVNSCTGTVAAAQCSLTLNTPGNRTLTASYGGATLFNPSTSAGEPHTVNPNAPLVLVVDNTSDDGALSACTAVANDCSLRGAISRANTVSTNDTINFDTGVFNVSRTIIVSNGELAVTDNGSLTINGTGANLLNISGGGGSSRVFNFSTNTPSVLNSLTVSGGNSDNGGGILANPTSLTINFCNISGNNTTGFGGGIFNINGTMNINSSLISGNTAASGGGIANGGNPAVLNISNSTISGNTSSDIGGGGIFLSGQMTVYTSTITNNTANGDGTNTGIGGGISNFTFESVSLGNTIVAGNDAPNSPDFRDALNSLGHNLIGNTSGTSISGNTDGNLLNVVAQLGSLTSNGGPTQTHALLQGSLAINGGNNFLAIDTNGQFLANDQRGTGFNRIHNSIVDIGAFENSLPFVTENPQSQTVVVGSAATFTSRAGVFSQMAPSSLSGGQALLPGQFLISPNYGYQFVYQTDGNLVLYRGDGAVLWNAGTFGTSPGRAEMQTDGNFVIYDANNNVQFSAGTFGNPGATLTLQDDGNVVIYNGSTAIYSTQTGVTGPDPIPAVQWQVSTDGGTNFTNIGGATTPILSFTAQLTDSGKQYRAIFTNTSGAVTSSAATLMVNKADTMTTITSDTPDPSDQGTAFTVSYNVAVVAPGTGTPTGNVTVSDGVDSCVGTAAAGSCSLTLNTVGNRTLTATYVGDTNFNSSVSAGESHTVITAAPLDLVVDNTTDNGSLTACTNAADDCSLRGAVIRANAAGTNDTINFDPVIFATPQTITLGGPQLSVEDSGGLTIQGPGANVLSISGNNNSRILEILSPVSVTLRGLTLTQGNGVGGTSAFGGAIRVFNVGASLNLDSIAVSGNNSSAGGGGVQISRVASANITNSTFSNNSAAFGGGALQIETINVVNITNSTISGNSSKNETSGGGGIRILNGNGVLNITNSTISNNTTGFDGGGIRQEAPFTVSLRNTVIAGNIDSSGGNSPDINGTITSQGYNLIGDGTGGTITATSGDQVGTNTSPINAMLAPLADNGGPTLTHALLPDSPSMNAGSNALAVDQNDQPLPNDQRGTGFPRIFDTNVDIGAYEVQMYKTTTVITCPPGTFVYTGSAITPCIATVTASDGLNTTAPVTYGNNTNVGMATADAIYAGDATHLGSIATQVTFSITAAPSMTTIDCSPGSFVYIGSPITPCSATVTGAGGLNTTVPVTHGNNTNVGTATADASYPGDTNHSNSTAAQVTFSITKADPTCTVTTYSVTFNGLPHTATGACLGVSSETLAGLDLSGTTHTNAGSYPTDPWVFTDVTGNYNDASGTVADNIDKANASCTITGYTLTYDANPHTATGQCTGVGGAGDVLAGLDLSGTTHTNAGNYLTDPWVFTDVTGNYNETSGTVADVINKADTTTSVSTSADPSPVGQTITFTATVAAIAPGAGVPTGTVSFSDGAIPIAGCQHLPLDGSSRAECSTGSLTIGSHVINVNYNGDGNFILSSGSLTQVVDKAETTTTVTAGPASPSVFGQSVTFTATVAAVAPGMGTPTGAVSFSIDGNVYCINTPRTFVGGMRQASCTLSGLPALPAGLRNVVAIYNGNATFDTSAGTLNYTVNKANTSTAITSVAPDPSLVGQMYTVTWTVVPDPVYPGSGSPTGTVTVDDGQGGTCMAPVAAGTCNLSSATVGAKILVATYSGDANFIGSVSPGVPPNVNLTITGTVRDGLTLAPVSGHPVFLNGCASSTTTTNASGVYTFTGPFTGDCNLHPTDLYGEPFERNYTNVLANITEADFLIFGSAENFPRKISFPTQFVVPGAAASMPVTMNSLGNEASVAFSITYDTNSFSQAPEVICGANSPECTITMDNSVFGKVGVKITAAAGGFSRPEGTEFAEAAGVKEIGKIKFSTLPTNLASTDFTIGSDPTDISVTEVGTPNTLLGVFVLPARVVFVQGLEGDLTTGNAGSGNVNSGDVTHMRRLITGLDTPVANHNAFQRADTAPAATRGDGNLNATDVIQTGRYAASLDPTQNAGGPGHAVIGPIAPSEAGAAARDRKEERSMNIGSVNGVTGSRVSVPVEMTANGDEVAASFTIRYDDTKLANPSVELAGGPRDGVTLTYNANETGVTRVLIDSTVRFGAVKEGGLVYLTFDVLETAASGDTWVEIEHLVISDASANELKSSFNAGRISIAGPNPLDTKGGRPTLREVQRQEFDIISEAAGRSPIVILRRKSDRPLMQR